MFRRCSAAVPPSRRSAAVPPHPTTRRCVPPNGGTAEGGTAEQMRTVNQKKKTGKKWARRPRQGSSWTLEYHKKEDLQGEMLGHVSVWQHPNRLN